MTRWAGPLACVALALVLRLFRLDAKSLWIDEGYTAYLASRSVGDIVVGTGLDVHPPLHYLLLHFWATMAGNSAFAFRFVSVWVGTASVAGIYSLTRRIAGERPALIAAALLAVSPFHVWYSQEARMYALLAFLAIVSSYLCLRLLERPTGRDWALYAIVGTAALYTQYYALFLLTAHGLVWVRHAGRFRRRTLAAWLATEAAIGLAFAPWVPIVVQQATGHRMVWLPEPSSDEVLSVVGEALLGIRDVGAKPLGYAIGAAALLVLAAAAARIRIGAKESGPRAGGWLVPALWLALPVAASIAISLRVTPIFHAKQFLLVLPPFVLLAALGLAPAARRLGAGPIAAAALLVALPGLYRGYFVYDKQDWRGLVSYIVEHRQPGDVVFLNPGASSSILDYYLTLDRATDLPRDGYPVVYEPTRGNWVGVQTTPPIAAARVDALARTYRRVWMVQFSAGFWDPGGLLTQQMKARFVERPLPGFVGLNTALYDVSGR